MTQEQFKEFLSTDSISRKSELREILHDAVDKYIHNKNEDTLGFTWYFPDAAIGEVGTFEKFYDEKKHQVEIKRCYFNNWCEDTDYYLMADILEKPV